MNAKICRQLTYGAVTIIGLYMILRFYGTTPPLLSGIAFVLIGVGELKKKKK